MRSFIYNMPILGKLVRVFEERNTDLVTFGETNMLPCEVMEGVAASGTATECIGLISGFTQADGFSDKAFQERRANPKQIWGNLLNEIADNIAMFEGVYINVQYTNEGKPGDFYIIPFDEIRRGTSGKFYRKVPKAGKPGWADKSLNGAIVYPEYNPALSPAEIMVTVENQKKANGGKQLGYIFFIYRKKLYPKWYPLGDFYAGWEDIESDAALQRLERRNIKKGFKPDVIISTLGEIDDENPDKDGKTDYDYWRENLKKFTGEDASSILHLFGKTGDTLPTVTPFPLKDLLNGIDLARKRVARAVCRHFKCPPILIIGDEGSQGWGDTKALVNSMKLFNKGVIRYQNMISDNLKKLFPGETVNTEITKLSIADYIDPAIKDIILANTINADQKIQVLIYVFGLNEEAAKKIVYGESGKPADTNTGGQAA